MNYFLPAAPSHHPQPAEDRRLIGEIRDTHAYLYHRKAIRLSASSYPAPAAGRRWGRAPCGRGRAGRRVPGPGSRRGRPRCRVALAGLLAGGRAGNALRQRHTCGDDFIARAGELSQPFQDRIVGHRPLPRRQRGSCRPMKRPVLDPSLPVHARRVPKLGPPRGAPSLAGPVHGLAVSTTEIRHTHRGYSEGTVGAVTCEVVHVRRLVAPLGSSRAFRPPDGGMQESRTAAVGAVPRHAHGPRAARPVVSSAPSRRVERGPQPAPDWKHTVSAKKAPAGTAPPARSRVCGRSWGSNSRTRTTA